MSSQLSEVYGECPQEQIDDFPLRMKQELFESAIHQALSF